MLELGPDETWLSLHDRTAAVSDAAGSVEFALDHDFSPAVDDSQPERPPRGAEIESSS